MLRYLDGGRLLRLSGDPFKLAVALDPHRERARDDGDPSDAKALQATAPSVAAAALASRFVDDALERSPAGWHTGASLSLLNLGVVREEEERRDDLQEAVSNRRPGTRL